jgi:hypothetical protein
MGDNVLLGLIGELEIILKGDAILDLPQNDWRGDHERAGKKCPTGSEEVHVGEFQSIEAVHNGGTRRLNCLVETSEECSLTAIVSQSTHEPVKERQALVTRQLLGWEKED